MISINFHSLKRIYLFVRLHSFVCNQSDSYQPSKKQVRPQNKSKTTHNIGQAKLFARRPFKTPVLEAFIRKLIYLAKLVSECLNLKLIELSSSFGISLLPVIFNTLLGLYCEIGDTGAFRYYNQLFIARQMAQVHINNIIVGNNPAKVTDPFLFNITFECFSSLPGTLDWKIIYIGSPNNTDCDQIIDSFDMENIAPGVMQFSVDSNCPDFNLIPKDEIIGTTAIIISVQYEKQEFFRCGYYVRNQYDQSVIQPPKNIALPMLRRYILAENPRIFRFEIEWAKREGNAYEDNELLQQNLKALGGDPFQQSNGALQELQKIEYSYGMFQNNTMPL